MFAPRTRVIEGMGSVAWGSLLLFVGTLVSIGGTFVTRVILVRSLSEADWSALSLGFAYAGLVSSFGSLGLGSAVARSLPYAESEERRRGIIRTALVVGGTAAVVASVLLYLLGPEIARAVSSPALAETLQLLALSTGFMIFGGLIASIFQGYEDVRPNAYFLQALNPFLFVFFLGALIALPKFGLTYLYAVYAYVAAAGVSLAAILVYGVRKLPRHLAPGPRAPGSARILLAFTAPLFASGVMAYFTSYGDTLVLGAFDSLHVGTYVASLTMARLLTLGIGALSYIFLPVSTKYFRDREMSSVRILYVTATKWMVLASLPLFLLFVFLPGPSLGLVYGSAYTSVTLPLQVVTLGAFLSTIVGPAAAAQVAFGQTRLLLYNSIVAGVADMGLAWVLIPHYGLLGAAIAWCSANAIYPALSLIEVEMIDSVHPFRLHFLVPLFATAVPAALLLLVVPRTISVWWLPPIGVGIALLFVAMTLVTRSIDEGDRLLLVAVEQMLGRKIPLVRRIAALVRPPP